MVAGDVVVLDAVLVKVVEHGEAALVALAVVGLTPTRPAKKEDENSTGWSIRLYSTFS